MKIINATKIEDCFDGSVIYEYKVDTSWSEENIFKLETFGKLEYFPDFPRPFFRVIDKSGLNIKGVGGADTCRVIFPKKLKEFYKSKFEVFFNFNKIV